MIELVSECPPLPKEILSNSVLYGKRSPLIRTFKVLKLGISGADTAEQFFAEISTWIYDSLPVVVYGCQTW
jgi:hypothetical protein